MIVAARPTISKVNTDNPEEFFAADAKALLDKMPDLAKIRITGNKILVANWVAPEKTSGGIIRIASTVAEDVWLGKAGLIVAMGPHAYEDDDMTTFAESEKAKVGDWVLFNRGPGARLKINEINCIMLLEEKYIDAILPRPDIVSPPDKVEA